MTKKEKSLLKNTIASLTESKGYALCSEIAKAMLLTPEPGFKQGEWCGHRHFLQMIKAYPGEFKITECPSNDHKVALTNQTKKATPKSGTKKSTPANATKQSMPASETKKATPKSETKKNAPASKSSSLVPVKQIGISNLVSQTTLSTPANPTNDQQTHSKPLEADATFDDFLNLYFTPAKNKENCARFGLAEEMTDYSIAFNYLRFTYFKAVEDAQLLENDQLRMFHTRWFYSDTDPIYCIWGFDEQNKPVFKFIRQEVLEGRRYKKLFLNRVPNPVVFQQIEFDAEKDIEPEFWHICNERFYRIPDEVKDMIRMSHPLKGKNKVSEDSSVCTQAHNFLRRLLAGCIDDTKRRIRNGREEAVQFWRKSTNQMGWLFPLRMGISDKVNLVAIVVPTTLNGKDMYTAPTVLELKDAFQSARLLGPVRAEWLKDAWKQPSE